PRGVRQERVARGVEVIEDRPTRRQAHAPERDGDDLGARRLVGLLHDLHRPVLARAHDQARRELLAPEDQIRVGHGTIPHRTMSPLASPLDAPQLAPPPLRRPASSLSPPSPPVAAQALLRVPSRLPATAVYPRVP